MLNVVLFGPPGAGKGTQSEILREKYSLVHISTGDVFRMHIKGATELGTLAKSFMDRGELVPDEVTIGMLRAEVEKHHGAAGFIFDGFPRTSAQAAALDELLRIYGVEPIRIEGAFIDRYHFDIVASYLNTGDAYATTLLLDHDEQRWTLTSWGDFLEANESKYTS